MASWSIIGGTVPDAPGYIMKMKQLVNPLNLVYLVGATATLVAVYLWFSPAFSQSPLALGTGQLAILPPKAIPAPPSVLRAPQAPGRLRVGIIAGHSGSDSGAICPDGLTEVSINTAIVALVDDKLAAQGVWADLMDEFDSQQEGYVASALVSIHADSCSYPGLTGYKVASLEGSTNPENQALTDCLINEFGRRTGLPFHPDTITPHMTHYHVFNTIAPQTPGAIIETGFMMDDREILTEDGDLVAQGIVDGILCFLSTRLEQR
jgi:N-acetylmuramoyl-L-alanine amidase